MCTQQITQQMCSSGVTVSFTWGVPTESVKLVSCCGERATCTRLWCQNSRCLHFPEVRMTLSHPLQKPDNFERVRIVMSITWGEKIVFPSNSHRAMKLPEDGVEIFA